MNFELTDLKLREFSKEDSFLTNDFDCGNDIVNNYLRYESLAFDVGKPFILTNKNENNILGFFSLTTDIVLEKNSSCNINKLKTMGSAIRIHMLGVDKKYQHKKCVNIDGQMRTLATVLLTLCCIKIQDIVDHHIGSSFIVLHSTKEGYNLYYHIGEFEKLESDMKIIDNDEVEETIPMFRNVYLY